MSKFSDHLPDPSVSPSDFMRARRPELFSDSVVVAEQSLSREVFDYHLESLTSRKEETVFEHFCRRLAEKALCPNLSPQTGPTGGGDSKCDAETHPVADQIALRWYEGDPMRAAHERWAFAFSAKEDWRSKAQSDVAKIAATGRRYDLIYFITSRYAKDKAKADLEDKLAKKYGVSVRILDRSWIMKQVFENNQLGLAIEALHLDNAATKSRNRLGPSDIRNTQRLQELEERIADTTRYSGAEYQLGEDCLSAALLARALELPRIEVEGRFDRAARVAEKVGHAQQQLRIAYNRAWTSYWWLEDIDEFLRFYAQVEDLAAKSEQATDLELLGNLWSIVYTCCRSGKLDPVTVHLERRTKILTSSLEQLSSDTSRPNNRLWARTQLLLTKIMAAAGDAEKIPSLLADFRGVVRSAEGLVAYPFEAVSKIVEEFGNWLSDVEEYDALLEQVVSITQKRVGAVEAGRVLLARGFQKLRAHLIYDAIRYFGRAQQKLALREAREELSEALFGCGLAYEAAGLLWAARANVLAAANQVLADYFEHGFLARQAQTCAKRLVWLEMQLGRVACTIQWMQVARAIGRDRGLASAEADKFSEQERTQDIVLGALLLRSDMEDLKRLRFLPDVLEGLGLEYSRIALLYALGHEELLRDEGTIPQEETTEAVRDFFTRWLKQSGPEDEPERPTGLSGGVVELTSYVIGCKLVVRAEDDDQSLLLAERILAAMEALLSTSLEPDVVPQCEEFEFRVERSNRTGAVPKWQFDDIHGVAVIQHSGHIDTTPDRETDWFLDLVLQSLARIIMPRDLDEYGRRVFGEEGGLGRAINFTDCAAPIRNILGREAKFTLSDWNNEGNPKSYSVPRSAPWHEGLLAGSGDQLAAEPVSGVGEAPRELLDTSAAKHKNRRVFSLINIHLWNNAKWNATLYAWPEGGSGEPMLALAFENREAGLEIFRQWIAKLGSYDKTNRLRVSIVTGISESQPFAYSVLIGSNIVVPKDSPVRVFISISRVNKMRPQNSHNLDNFRQQYERSQSYLILPAFWPGSGGSPDLVYDLAIRKNEIRICEAWEIGENDMDAAAIGPDDVPIIPTGVQDAPVLRLIERQKRRTVSTRQ